MRSIPHVDTDAERYLEFEKWWGDFIQLNGDELQFLVDNLFIGDKLTRNQLQSRDGTIFDLRNITSPIIVFTSTDDNISPPPQTLGWILDLYRDVEDIRATGRTIVYCLSHKIGHLALFVSAKVGAKEDEEFVQLMDVIDCLPPGLYEMVISPRPADVPAAGFVTGDWIARFEARSLDDIRALGRNSPEDDRAFAAVARLSELNLSTLPHLHAALGARARQPAGGGPDPSPEPAQAQLHDLRRQQPLDEGRADTGCQRGGDPQAGGGRQSVPHAAERRSRTKSRPLWMPIAWRVTNWHEQMFFGFYGSPFVQALLGINAGSEVRPFPGTSPEKLAARQAQTDAYAAKLQTGGFDEALTRAVLYVIAADRTLDQRCALALNVARQQLMHLSLAEFKVVVRDQFFVLQLEP